MQLNAQVIQIKQKERIFAKILKTIKQRFYVAQVDKFFVRELQMFYKEVQILDKLG